MKALILAMALMAAGAVQAGGIVAPVTEPDPVVVDTTTDPATDDPAPTDPAPTDPAPTDPDGNPVADPAPADPAAATDDRDDPPRMPGPPLVRSPEFAWKDAQAASAATPAPVPEGALYVTATSMNLRGGPSTQNAVVGKLKRGDIVTPTGAEENGWLPVLLADGRTRGYASAKFLSAEAP